MQGRGEGRGDPGYLRGQHLGRSQVRKALREFFATVVHQARVNLMVDKAVHFENSARQNLAVAPNALLKFLHACLPASPVNSNRFYITHVRPACAHE